jgi:hypothetical protein
MELSYHIQQCDFSVQEFDPISFDEAVRVVKSIDWSQKLIEKQIIIPLREPNRRGRRYIGCVCAAGEIY